jgi:hypothetical protein
MAASYKWNRVAHQSAAVHAWRGDSLESPSAYVLTSDGDMKCMFVMHPISVGTSSQRAAKTTIPIERMAVILHDSLREIF